MPAAINSKSGDKTGRHAPASFLKKSLKSLEEGAVGHDHRFGQIFLDTTFYCHVRYDVLRMEYHVLLVNLTQYAIRNTQYAIRNTQYAIRNTQDIMNRFLPV